MWVSGTSGRQGMRLEFGERLIGTRCSLSDLQSEHAEERNGMHAVLRSVGVFHSRDRIRTRTRTEVRHRSISAAVRLSLFYITLFVDVEICT